MAISSNADVSETVKTCSRFFFVFLQSTLNLEYFEKKRLVS